MAEHLHIDYPMYKTCNQLIEEVDWSKCLDNLSQIETVKVIGLITMMYDFPELMALTDGIVWS